MSPSERVQIINSDTESVAECVPAYKLVFTTSVPLRWRMPYEVCKRGRNRCRASVRPSDTPSDFHAPENVEMWMGSLLNANRDSTRA
ncbi:hypothetical protein EVAR_89668_1 [Eumeta japonica]|uniref:Uncharacterized protein n=1 Tax=Eumeta variegata TaxID=151549 RepID=A0A4C1YCK4_EUMVA|nr:hypothetical protein EVAR_89668_1 [Eumeta japonica]